MAYEVSLLGEVKGSRAGRDVDLGSSRQRALFAILAMRANGVVSREELIQGVWGEDPPATVDSSIYTYVARLRRALEPQRRPRASSEYLRQEGSGYRLRLAPHLVDVNRFHEHLRRAQAHRRAGELRAAVQAFDNALAQWKGSAFAGLSGPSIEAERNHLEERRVTAIEERLRCLLDLGHTEEALSELSTMAYRYPLSEQMRGLLMMAYHRSGRRAEALDEFRDIRRRLIAELGIEPGAELQAAHREILLGDAVRPAAQRPLREPVEPGAPMVPAQLPHDVSAFTGREDQMARLHVLHADAEAVGETPVLAIDGPPGTGKTALAVHFAHEVAWRFDSGQLYLDMGGPDPLTAAHACDFLLDSLGIVMPQNGPSTHTRRVGYYRSALAGRRLLILLDDVRSVDQVRPLLPGTTGCLVIVTSHHRLSGLAARNGASLVTLDALPEADAVTLMRRVVIRAGGAPPHGGLLAELSAACGYLPGAVRSAAERIAAFGSAAVSGALERGELLDLLDSGCDAATSVRSTLDATLSRLPELAVRVFSAFGTMPVPELGVTAAARLAGVGCAEARGSLETLARARLAHACGRARFRMNPLFHAYARELFLTGQWAPDTPTVPASRPAADREARAGRPGAREADVPQNTPTSGT